MHPYLLKGLPLGPILVRRFAERIPAYQLDHCFEPDRFTTREVVAHLADWEVLFRTRMELALESPGSKIQVHEEGERAISERYCDLDLQQQLNKFEAEREKTTALIAGLSPEQLRAPYLHPAFGVMHVEDQANMLLGHDLYHVEQLSAYLDVAIDLAD